MNLNAVQRAKDTKPSADKIIAVGDSGVCKTTFGAWAPKPLYLSALGEGSGIRKLAEAKRIPEDVAWFPEITDKNQAQGDGWNTLIRTLAGLINEKHDFKTIVFDCFDDEGFLNLAYHHHDRECYDGNMGVGKNGFMNFQNGYSTCLEEIKRVTHGAMNMLVAQGIDVILLMHATTTNFKNPDGCDYHRHTPNVNQKHVWPLLRGWADMVLYFGYESAAVGGDDDGRGAKGVGGDRRVIHCTHSATHDAKNRHGLPSQIVLPEDYTKVYSTFADALKQNNKPKATAVSQGDN